MSERTSYAPGTPCWTDWRRQIREHGRELAVGTAAAGFLIGGTIPLRRRR